MPATKLLAPLPSWVGASEPEGDCVLLTQLSLVRNLSDFPFPDRCTAEERTSVLERVLSAFESINLLASGEFLPIKGLDDISARLLAERRLLTIELLHAKSSAGLYVSKDQCLSISINSIGHVCMRALAPGLQLQEAWQRLSALDDALGSVLDFAWDERLGFLTGEISRVGTGLKAGVLMHLPTTTWANQTGQAKQAAASRRLLLEGLRPGPIPEGRSARRAAMGGVSAEQVRDQALFTNFDGAITGNTGAAVGDLYFLVNRGTLGEAEEEILFHVRHTAMELLAAERDEREKLGAASLVSLEDRVGRAHGVARGARLLGFSEALALLSTLRVGSAAGLLLAPMHELTELLLRSQAGHLQAAKGQALDAVNLTIGRADLFRGRFGAAR